MPSHTHKDTYRQKPWWILIEITQLSYTTLFFIWVGLAFCFAFAYFFLDTVAPLHGPAALVGQPPLQRFFNSLYYSIITATSTGYGDITPRGLSKAFASLQSMGSLFIFAVFVTKLVSQRQEIALQEVHKLTYEDIFHNTREDLYIIRRDLDSIILEAKESKTLSTYSWETLMIAFQQMQGLISEIPEFYDGGNSSYTIDARREKLLMEAVNRTLQRINETLDAMAKAGIDWTENTESANELNDLIHVIDEATPLWEQRSPYKKHVAFEDILSLKENIHDRIAQWMH